MRGYPLQLQGAGGADGDQPHIVQQPTLSDRSDGLSSAEGDPQLERGPKGPTGATGQRPRQAIAMALIHACGSDVQM